MQNGGVSDHTTPLLEEDLDADPLRQFESWIAEAADAVREPEAMALATATASGEPSSRMVLLKKFDDRGFVFFSNYASRKGRELEANPRAALLFHWEPLGRQIRIEGAVERTSPEETTEYIRSRPRGSQLSAIASPQSQRVHTREELEERVRELEQTYAGADLPLPEDWGGFRLTPEAIEFWQQRRDRLHDRFRYVRDGDDWLIERLAP
jgi:pyridoxamine 5'-phosphate oxidase